jgi:hypothetical protein
MGLFTCPQCKKVFNVKRSYDNHLNKKIPCILDKHKGSKPAPIICKHCKQSFSRKDGLNRHLDSNQCSVLNSINNTLINNGTINNNNGMINNNEIVNNNNTTTNNNEIVNNNNTTTNNNENVNIVAIINMVPYATDGIETITKKDIASIITDDRGIIVGLLKFVNFNSDKPQNQNIYYPDNKNGTMKVFTNKWETLPARNTMRTIFYVKMKDINDIYNKFGDKLLEEYAKYIRKVIKDHTLYDTDSTVQVGFKTKNIKNSIKDMLSFAYNNKDMTK